MRYKFAFIQDNLVPAEHKLRDLQRWKERGMQQMADKMMADYNYESEFLPNGQEKNTLELVVMNSQKYHEAIVSIGRLLIYHPDLKSVVLRVLQDADRPDNNTNPTHEDQYLGQ